MIIGEMCPWHDLPLDGDGKCPLGAEGGYALRGNAVTVTDADDDEPITVRGVTYRPDDDPPWSGEQPEHVGRIVVPIDVAHRIMYGEPSDEVDHPAHYGGADDPFEPIKIIEAKNLGFHVGNALKYMLRAGHKPGEPEAKDLSKAVWYLNRRIGQLDDGED